MIGSRVNVPLYTPRLPIGGGGGVFQPSGGTPYKPFSPNPFAETLGGIGQILEGFRRKKELERQRELDERKMALWEEYRRAQIEKMQRPERPERPTRAGQIGQYMTGLEPGSEEWLRAAGIGETEVSPFGKPPYFLDPRYRDTPEARIAAGLEPRVAQAKAGYPKEYKIDLANAVTAMERGADQIKVFRRLATQYPQYSAEIKRILLHTPAENRLEALKQILFGSEVSGGLPSKKPVSKTKGVRKTRPGLEILAEKSALAASGFQPMEQGVLPERLRRLVSALKGREPETIPANLGANVGLEGIANMRPPVGRGYARGDRPGTYLPFDPGYTGTERPGVHLPFDPGFAGKERPGVHLPWDIGYTGDERPGVHLPFDEGYVAPEGKAVGKAPAVKAGKPSAKGVAAKGKKGLKPTWAKITPPPSGSTGVFDMENYNFGATEEPAFRRVGGTPGSIEGIDESAARIFEHFANAANFAAVGPRHTEREIADWLYEQAYQERKSQLFGAASPWQAPQFSQSGQSGAIDKIWRKARHFGVESITPQEKEFLRQYRYRSPRSTSLSPAGGTSPDFGLLPTMRR